MKKALIIIFSILLAFLIIFFGFLIYLNSILDSINLDSDKLISFEQTIVFYDDQNNVIKEEHNGKMLSEISSIPEYTKNAFIAIEDKRFYSHNGIDIKGLFRATFNNLKSRSFKEGASTISQQLIKNTHLTSEKTLKRKLIEIKLAKELEKKYSKDDILEKYLNTIYFGDNCYGITSASKHYFNKLPSQLDINESAILAAIIKAPTNYSPYNNSDKCKERKNIVLSEMFNQGYINKEQFDQNVASEIVLSNGDNEDDLINDCYLSLVKNQVNNIVKNSPYSLTHLDIYTTINSTNQKIIQDQATKCQLSCDKSIILIDKNGKIKGYYSTCGDINRQVGSIIKPLISYAPAIELDKINSATKLNDEKTDFNGYSPNNYMDKYYGNISCKDSLAKSSNVCAVKLLNYVGIDKAKEFLNKMNIQLSDNDNSLCLALGAFENGIKLTNITSCYSIFNNNGYYIYPTIIDKISDKNGQIIYKNQTKKEKVFSEETISIMNDMLKNVVKNGTAKKLSYSKATLYGKTGTVGSKEGNTDAYTISYNCDYILGTWLGNKDNSMLDNTISGGNEPAKISKNIYDEIYKDKNTKTEIIPKGNIKEIYIDRECYEKDNIIILADDIAPLRYKIKTLIKSSSIPKIKSDRFSCPKIEKPKILVNNNSISLSLCLTEFYDAVIFRAENNGEFKMIYDTKNNSKEIFIDNDILPETTYQYKITPYYLTDKNKYFGQEIVLDKIKSPIKNDIGEWWEDDFD